MLSAAQADHIRQLYPELAHYTDLLTYDDVTYLMRYLAQYSGELRKQVRTTYFGIADRMERNTFIRHFTDDLRQRLPRHAEAVCCRAETVRYTAEQVFGHIERQAKLILSPYTYTGNNSNPNSYTGTFERDQFLYKELASYMRGINVAPLEPNNQMSESGCIRRMLSLKWLKGRIRKQMKEVVATAEILLGTVSKRRSLYVGEETAYTHQRQLAQTKMYLQRQYLRNQAGELLCLYDAHKASVANPEIRRKELMTRIAGTEAVAKARGDIGLFITVTCPSKYHNAHARSGQRNKKWDGSLPNQAQRYLSCLWARIRSELKRQAISTYGLRVVEPQHDGTPHWHLLLFVSADQADNLAAVMRDYALKEDGNERGAKANRCDVKRIDPKRGSAAGYVAKYIAKNIDGQGLDSGVYGECPNLAAAHVAAWASCWSIRQFQMIGLPSVTVWRELRRLIDTLPDGSPFEKLRQAADNGDWQEYVSLMGGVAVAQRSRPAKPLYQQNVNPDTGEIAVTEYDQQITMRLSGVTNGNQHLLTRCHHWTRSSKTEAA